MRLDRLTPGVILRGPIFPEPVQVMLITPMGASVKIIGKGLTTGKLHDPILTADQLALLEATPEKEPFDGDPKRFRLGIEALRLALAYEYRTAERLKKDYWLYAVFDCGTAPRVHAIQDPTRLGWQPVVQVEHYHVSAKRLLEAAMPAKEVQHEAG